jgi:DNA primase
MGKITKELSDKIKSSIDLSDYIIKNYPGMNLRKEGKNYSALCPFHSETKPSFMISPEKQIFNCFGCMVGGDIFKFVMKMEGYSYPEAVIYLGEQAGIDLSSLYGIKEQINKDRKRINDLHLINEKAAEFFNSQLYESEEANEARKYLAGRGLENDIIKEFRLGYAPKDYSRQLINFLPHVDNMESVLSEASLIKTNDYGHKWTYFKDRIIIPLQDQFGKFAGFAARPLDDESLPKYLNSEDSLVYKKTSFLYGLNKARLAIRQEGKAVVVEGYFDTMANHQYGIANTVGLGGTALTANQARILKKFSDETILCYDNDESGIRSALKSGISLINANLENRLILLPKQENQKKIDPDEFIRSGYNRAEEFLKLEENALPVFEYKIETIKQQIKERKYADDDSRIIEELIPFIAATPSLLKKQIYVQKVAKEFGLENKVVLKAMSGHSNQKENHELEEELLRIIFKWPAYAGYIESHIEKNSLSDKTLNLAYSYVLDNASSEKIDEIKISPGNGLFNDYAMKNIIKDIKEYCKRKKAMIDEDRLASFLAKIIIGEEKIFQERIDFLIDVIKERQKEKSIAEIQESIRNSKNPAEISNLLDKYLEKMSL